MCQVEQSQSAALAQTMVVGSLLSSPTGSCANSPAHGRQKSGCPSDCKQDTISAWTQMMTNNVKLWLFVPHLSIQGSRLPSSNSTWLHWRWLCQPADLQEHVSPGGYKSCRSVDFISPKQMFLLISVCAAFSTTGTHCWSGLWNATAIFQV